ncbi:glycoside hydrolase domain-containing protein [Micropruina sp.]|uniref:glycoside hydrolase domain-containing protein n=1 Tax=Micropruina sp. TaxID=2737536 RepID=UPI0039E22421
MFSFSYRPADGIAVIPMDLVIPADAGSSLVDTPSPVELVETHPAADHSVTADTELHWAFYADDAAALQAPWASLAVCPDVVFDDGSRLSDGLPDRGEAADRYGFPVTPSDQFAARWSMPQQWNADTVSLAPWAGRRISAIEVVLGDESLVGDAAAAELATGWVEVVVRRAEALRGSPAEWVDTRRGTHAGARFSRGNTLPAVAHPRGFVFLTPATDAADTRWPYRWGVHDEPAGRRLAALQTSHQPSPWIGDHGVLQFLPYLPASGGPSGHGGHIVPGTELAQPHRYAATLIEGIEVEGTSTAAVVAVRVRSAWAGLLVGWPQGDGSLVLESLPDGRVMVHGWIGERPDAAWGNAPRMYVYGETAERAAVETSGEPYGLGVMAPGQLELRVATSFLSTDQARRTFALEAPWTSGFDELVPASRARWDAICGAVELPAPADDRYALAHRELRARLAHALYRLNLYPNTASENAGTADAPEWRFADVFTRAEPHGEEVTGAPIASGRLVVNNGYWDTYRTVWPLLALLDADGTGELLDGQLEQVRRGGWTARWSGPGYIDCMVGTSSDQVYAQAARLGVGGFDRELAYESGWRNACEPSPDARTGRAGTASARFTGHVPREIHAGLSWTIEAAIGDAALGRFAELLAESASEAERYRAHARYFANRSLSYRQLFDPETGFFRGRSAAGRDAAGFDPAVWGGDYVETNAWGMSASAVHDGAGLAELFGGPAALREHLDRLFAEPETIVAPYHPDQVVHEQVEARAQRSGMCALSNQPAHHLPFMYLHTDQPWRAAPLARELAGRLFAGGHIGQGFPGDEDNGEMSGWWLWALLGLYPLDPGSAELVIGTPLVDDVTLRRDIGPLRVRVNRESPDASYLAAASWNGRVLIRPRLTPAELAEPGLLEIDLVDEPPIDAPLWQAPPVTVKEWQPDLCHPEFALANSGVNAQVVFDDGADPDGCRLLAPGDWVGQDFGAPKRVTDLTVTSLDATDSDVFVIEHSEDGLVWQEAPATHHELLPANRTTPFQLATPVSSRYWRVRVTAPLRLRQLEFFDLDPDGDPGASPG